ncbi:MAG: nitroreductase family protein [Clostridia bacterium]|nr:nitroreductase family protein [Clostridia bacterium]
MKDLIRKNRSYRRFDESKRQTVKELESLVESARFSPSAGNMQRLRFRLVHEKEECEYLFGQLAWAGYLKDWQGPERGERPTSYILILSPQEKSALLDVDIGIAAQSIMLTAVAQGLGGCMLASFHQERTNARFAPEGMRVRLVLALGAPVERVELCDAVGADIHYYRLPDGTHRVPKLPLDALIVK